MTTVLKFPEDFKKQSHPIIPGATQWIVRVGEKFISIVGGGFGIHGNGKTTFEMWDTRNMYDPEGHMTEEEINEHLQKHPIEEILI